VIRGTAGWLAGTLVALTTVLCRAEGPPAILAPGEVLRGAFVQERHLQGFREPLRSEGRFVLSPERGLIWRVETPIEVVTVITPDGMLQSSEGATIARVPAARIPMLAWLRTVLNGVLAGDWTALEREFAVERHREASGWRVELVPRNAGPALAIRSVTVAGARFAERVEIRRDGGDTDRLAFRDQSVSARPPSDEEAALLASAGR
jgi:hypothetical protein